MKSALTLTMKLLKTAMLALAAIVVVTLTLSIPAALAYSGQYLYSAIALALSATICGLFLWSQKSYQKTQRKLEQLEASGDAPKQETGKISAQTTIILTGLCLTFPAICLYSGLPIHAAISFFACLSIPGIFLWNRNLQKEAELPGKKEQPVSNASTERPTDSGN